GFDGDGSLVSGGRRNTHATRYQRGLDFFFVHVSGNVELGTKYLNGLGASFHQEGYPVSVNFKISLTFQLYHPFLPVKSGWILQCGSCIEPNSCTVGQADLVSAAFWSP